MKITPKTIELATDFPKKPTITQVDALMRTISDVLDDGNTYIAVKLSGFWVIGKRLPAHRFGRIFGGTPGENTRDLDTALARAFNRAVIRTWSLR